MEHDPWTEEQGDAGADAATEERTRVVLPRRYRVLLHNDDYTTMEFVVRVLMEVFHKMEAEAIKLMLDVHQKGVGVAGVFPRDIAETKATQAVELARGEGMPLKCTTEPE